MQTTKQFANSESLLETWVNMFFVHDLSHLCVHYTVCVQQLICQIIVKNLCCKQSLNMHRGTISRSDLLSISELLPWLLLTLTPTYLWQDYSWMHVNAAPSPGWSKEFWCRKGLCRMERLWSESPVWLDRPLSYGWLPPHRIHFDRCLIKPLIPSGGVLLKIWLHHITKCIKNLSLFIYYMLIERVEGMNDLHKLRIFFKP